MRRVRETIVVEGVYDKDKLKQVVDANVVAVNGFRVFHDKDGLRLLESLARKDGVVLLTDSDYAGQQIRAFVRQRLHGLDVKNAYVPQIAGKEKRKASPSAAGYLGVEGLPPAVILKALEDAGCHIDDTAAPERNDPIYKSDLYRWGLSGGEGSRQKREQLLKRLGLPCTLPANSLLDVLNVLYGKEKFEALLFQIQE